MTEHYRTKGFVFKKIDRNESDRVFSVFTEDFGRLEVAAKAIRKMTSKLRGGIDIFYLSEIEFIQGKNKKTLTGALTLKNINHFLGDIQKVNLVYGVSELIDGFIKGQESDRKTFELTEEFLENIYSAQKIGNWRMAFHYFFWNFLSLQGYKLEVDVCARCRERLIPYNIYFSGGDGGIICGHCAAVKKGAFENCEKINSDVAKVLRLVLNKDWQTISRLKIGEPSQKMIEDACKNAVHAFSPVHA